MKPTFRATVDARAYVLAGVLLCFSFMMMPACSAPVQEVTSAADTAEAEAEPPDDKWVAYLEQRMKLEDTPGLSIAIVEEGRPPAFYNFGRLSPNDSSAAVSEHTLYEIGSVTKTFTAGLYAVLMRDTAYADAFPQGFDTPLQTVLAHAGAELSLPDAGGDAITIAHLLTHRSGLPRLPQNMTPDKADDPYRDYTRRQLSEALSTVELQAEPGSTFAYSNFGFMVLGYAAEQLTGQDYDELIATYITRPLDMAHTAREPDAAHARATPTMYGQAVSPWRFEELRGLGELHSSARDMARYLEAQLGQRDYEHADAFTETHAEVAPVYEAADMSMGLGWFRETSAGHTLISHGGGTGGFGSYVAFHPESGRGVAVLANSTVDVGDIARHLLHPEADLKPLPDMTPREDELLSRVVGLYVHEQLPLLTVSEREGTLRAQLDGQPSFPMEYVAGEEESITFRNLAFGVEMEFSFEDGPEQASGLQLRQAGQVFDFAYTPDVPEAPQEIELPAEVLSTYEGRYASSFGMSYEIFMDSERLMARLTGQPAAQIHPEGDDRFFYKAVPAAIEFQRDENGDIEALTLLQGGQEILFLRSEDE